MTTFRHKDNMGALQAKAISARQLRELLDRYRHAVDEELSRALLGPVHALDDGSAVLLLERGRAIHYSSLEELRASYREGASAVSRPGDIWLELIPQQRLFPEQVPLLLKELSQVLGIEEATLDPNEANCEVVDQAVRKLGRAKVLTPTVFPCVLAWVGEAIRVNVNGTWEMRPSRGGESWEPWVIGHGGLAHPVLRIYKEIQEYGVRGSLCAFINAEIRAERGRA